MDGWCFDLRVDLAGKFQSPQVRSVSTLILLHRMIDETQATGLHSIHHPGSKDQLLSKRDADGPGESLGASCTGETKKLALTCVYTWPSYQLKNSTGNY